MEVVVAGHAKRDVVGIVLIRALALVMIVVLVLAVILVHTVLNTSNISKSVSIKQNRDSWQSGMAKNITFIVTKDRQLACKYCYLVGKNVKERMP